MDFGNTFSHNFDYNHTLLHLQIKDIFFALQSCKFW